MNLNTYYSERRKRKKEIKWRITRWWWWWWWERWQWWSPSKQHITHNQVVWLNNSPMTIKTQNKFYNRRKCFNQRDLSNKRMLKNKFNCSTSICYVCRQMMISLIYYMKEMHPVQHSSHIPYDNPEFTHTTLQDKTSWKRHTKISW